MRFGLDGLFAYDQHLVHRVDQRTSSLFSLDYSCQSVDFDKDVSTQYYKQPSRECADKGRQRK